MSTEVLSDTCNLYLSLQRIAHKDAAQVGAPAKKNARYITEFYFRLMQKTPLPTTLSLVELKAVKTTLDGLKNAPTIKALTSVYEELEGWFMANLPEFVPTKKVTKNEDNITMRVTNQDLGNSYSEIGNDFMDKDLIDFEAYKERRNELTLLREVLRRQLEIDQINVSHPDNKITDDFAQLVNDIKGATSSSIFFKQADEAITSIKKQTELRGV